MSVEVTLEHFQQCRTCSVGKFCETEGSRKGAKQRSEERCYRSMQCSFPTNKLKSVIRMENSLPLFLLCAFAPLRLCASAPLRLCVKKSSERRL
jgi:hypothetical protein